MSIQKKRKSFFMKTGLASILLVGFVCGLVFLFTLNPTEIITSHGMRGWQNFASAEGTLPAGASGYLYFMVYPHSADPGTTYKTNLSNATAYEFSDTLDTEMTGETPYNTAFDFVLKFRVNDTVGYNVSGTKWMDSWVRANLSVDFQFAADIGPLASMTIIQIVNNSDYAWYHAYMNNGGAGYQITKGETFNCTTIRAQGYW